MDHIEQVKSVISSLQETINDPTKGALVMTYENVAGTVVGEVHILAAAATPYARVVGMLVACMQAVTESTDVPMEKLMHDMADLLDQRGVVTGSVGPIH